MTAIQLIDVIKETALSKGFMECHYGNVNDLTGIENLKYPLLNVHINYLQEISTSVHRINITLVYMDRLLQDSTNTLFIQSDGVIALTELINTLYNDEIEREMNVMFTPFSESVNDNTAGVFTNINFQVSNIVADCEEL